MKKLTDKERARLMELISKKKAKSLTNDEAKELANLNAKCGYSKVKQESDHFVPGNDFSWWDKEHVLTEDCASFKSNYVAGMPIAGSDLPVTVVGVARIMMQSVYGSNRWATDPINVWARDLYLRMFQKYRPASGYSASDLGIAIIAGVEAIKLIAKYERIYGVINRYSRLNINMPIAEATALGLSTLELNYLQGHMSDFRYDLNFLIKKAQRLCIPKDISIVADAISLFGYEYLDHDSPRSQIIIFDFRTLGNYSDTAISAGGSIQFDEFDSLNPLFDFNADNMCVALNNQLSALLGSDSIQRIYADLVVWFGDTAMLQFNPVPSDYVIVPVYNESMLHKMHNLETYSSSTTLIHTWADNNLSSADEGIVLNGLYHVYQVDDRIVTLPTLEVANGTHTPISYDGGKVLATNGGVNTVILRAHLLDTYRADVNPETVVEGVMYKFTSQSVSDSGNDATVITSCAFYIVTSVITYKLASGTAVTQFNGTTTDWNDSPTAQSKAGALAILDWAPLCYSVSAGVIIDVFGDIDNVVPLYSNDISRLHRTIQLSGLKTDVAVVNK